jgi:hypothetical protein
MPVSGKAHTRRKYLTNLCESQAEAAAPALAVTTPFVAASPRQIAQHLRVRATRAYGSFRDGSY